MILLLLLRARQTLRNPGPRAHSFSANLGVAPGICVWRPESHSATSPGSGNGQLVLHIVPLSSLSLHKRSPADHADVRAPSNAWAKAVFGEVLLTLARLVLIVKDLNAFLYVQGSSN